MQGRRYRIPEVMQIGLAIAQAVAEAHQHAILHRDLKPANVMITEEGRICVLDFGLAQDFSRSPHTMQQFDEEHVSFAASEEDDLERFASITKGLRGTPLYMAPEQWKGKRTTGATDIWAIGVILYELLVGRRPYEETDSIRQAQRVCSKEAIPPIDQNQPIPPGFPC